MLINSKLPSRSSRLLLGQRADDLIDQFPGKTGSPIILLLTTDSYLSRTNYSGQ
jgi:hypothetical protein